MAEPPCTENTPLPLVTAWVINSSRGDFAGFVNKMQAFHRDVGHGSLKNVHSSPTK